MSRSKISMRRLTGLALLLGAIACNDEALPTSPRTDAPAGPEGAPPSPANNVVLSDRAHSFTGDDYELLSSAAEREAGLYRFGSRGTAFPDVERDDFILAADGDGVTTVHRVLEASRLGDELVLDTGPAYWQDVLTGGTYQLTVPIDGRGEGTFSRVGPDPVSISLAADGVDLPPIEREFHDTDVCQVIDTVLALIPGNKERKICGREVEMEVAYGASVAVSGTLDSLRILDGRVRVDGELDLSLTVDAGSISGGEAPSFYPCNIAAYLGCMSTPTGAALIDFLRRYAPNIPDASLPPVRVCIPGTPVRVRAGYWSGWTWVKPIWRTCAIADIGQLPTIVLPSVQAAATEVRPHIVGFMTMRAKGDGVVTLEIPIPGLGAKAGYGVTNDFKAKAAIGVFVLLRATLKNQGATVTFDFDDTGKVTQSWSSAAGWNQDFDVPDRSNHTELVQLDRPDTVVVRVGLPVKVNAEACLALTACGKTDEEGGDPDNELEINILGKELLGGFNLGVKAGVGVSVFEDAIYSRDQIDPDDPEVDNWHISLEGAYDIFGQAGVRIPLTGWILPNVPREIGGEKECCRVSMADYWGQGKLTVSVSTTGTGADADGYKVLAERYDTLPTILDDGAQRIGPGWPHRVHGRKVDVDGDAKFGQVAAFLPCIAVYSDSYVWGNPVWGLSVAAARAAGVGIPNYGVTSPCRWLIGRYKVTLTDVASNCTVVGGPVRDDVWLQQVRYIEPSRSDEKHVHFDVECGTAGPQGTLSVALPPGVRDPDAPPYLLMDGTTAAVFEESDTVMLTGLTPGAYEITLEGLSTVCASDPATVDVLADQVTETTPSVACAVPDPGPGTVTYTSTLAGAGTDANGYEIRVDGVPGGYLPVDGAGAVEGIGASEPTVFLVSDIAGNCQAETPNPRVVTLDASRTPVQVDFPITCLDVKPDTLIGSLDASGWPAQTVTVRAVDGSTLVVNGPKTDELAHLTGTSVRVWGRVSATGIDVHGYDLRSKIGDDRWLGIVLDRPDGTWLFGDEALRLVDPPAGLVGASGSLVWVMGEETAEGLQPTLYGVIRGG